MRGLLLGGAMAAALAGPGARGQSLTVSGAVRHPAELTLDQLRALPNATVQWSTDTEHGVRSSLYEGPLLWELVRLADPVDTPGEGAAGRSHLQHTILARGADGYAAAFAIGEIDPGFEGKKIIVSLPRDGQSTLQLAVPGDRRAGRGVHDLVALEIR